MTARLHAQENGAGTQAVLLLHGFGGTHADWAGLVPSLADEARVVAFDLPGHGRSLDYPGAGAAKLAAAGVLADMDARGIGSVHVAGHSMGGAVAVLMALAAPQRMASLTLLAPGGFGEEINAPLLRRYAAATEAADIRACLAEMSGPGHDVPQQAVNMRVAMRALPGQAQKLVEIAAAMTRGDRQGRIPREMLAGLSMPVSVAWGSHDRVLPVSQADDLPPAFRLHRVEGAGHMLIDEAPGLVAGLILAAMERTQGEGR
ncbi:Dihydrolipoyllysine-residue acetyltransferase component of acetoin cleaving system [Aquamicrobium terrae]